MLRVRDIMTRHVLTLRASASVRSAAWSLHTAHVSGAPVRDNDGNVVGVLSTTDLSALARAGDDPELVSIADAMTPVVWSIHPDAPAIDAVRMMVARGIHRVLAVRRPGEVEGIVTAMDVLRALADGHTFSESTAKGDADAEQATDGR